MSNIMILPNISYDDTFEVCAEVFCLYAKQKNISFSKGEDGINLIADDALCSEQSKVEAKDRKILVYASTVKGMHIALAKILGNLTEKNGCVYFDDEFKGFCPKMHYRGLMVDLARQKHSVDYILKYIDECYLNGATHLQLHFTDNESFTLPVKSFPLLSTPGRTYSEQQISHICEYAKARGIIIVPEVDIPGHTKSFCESYPELFKSGKGNHEIMGATYILPATEEVFDAINVIFQEVAAMFPDSPLIHIGGDEAAIDGWETCEKTQNYMKKNGIKDIHHMYAEFIRRSCDIVIGLGRTPVVWEGFSKEYNHIIPKSTIVICWEYYYQTAVDLAKAGFQIINSSWRPLYIVTGRDDWYFAPEEITKWNPWFWRNWWKKSLSYPDGVTINKQGADIIGGQLCAWGDGLRDMKDYEKGLETELEQIRIKLPLFCNILFEAE